MRRITRTKSKSVLTFDNLLSEFIASRVIKNVRQSTIDSYNRNTVNFKNWLDANQITDLARIEKDTIKDYMMYLQSNYTNQSTINSYLRHVKALLYFAMEDEQGYITKFTFSLPKEDVEVGKTYTNAEIKRLIAKPNFKTCYDGEYKMWVIVNYMLDTGNRLSTVRHIKVEDVFLQHFYVIMTHTKNREHAFVPISKQLAKILRKYISDFGLRDDDFLFPNVMGKMYTSSGLYHEIKKYNKKRKVETSATHAFRRTFASNYIATGGDAFNLKKLLGHKSLKMTERYVKLYDNTHTIDFESHSIIANNSSEYTIKRLK